MNKILKITIFLVLFILIIHHSIYAIDMNLSNNTVANNTSTNLTTNTVNTSITNTNNVYDDENEDENYYTQANTSTNTLRNSNVTPSTTVTTTYQESTFGLSEYLNIAIIVIGILLIFLSIAILIRLKN